MKRSLMTGIIALSSITSFIGTDHALGQVYKAGQVSSNTEQTYTSRIIKTPHKILRPTKSPVNQDFMMTYTFDAPGRAINLSIDDFSVDNGTLIDLVPLPANVFKLKIRPNSNFRDYGEQVTVRTSKHGDSQVSIQITEPTSYASGNTPTSDSSSATLHLQVTYSQGGEPVNSTKHNLGDGNEIQAALAIPLSSHKNPDTIRLGLGYKKGDSGSESKGNYSAYRAIIGDILYNTYLNERTSISAGLTFGIRPNLDSQGMTLKNTDGTGTLDNVDGIIRFKNYIGAKIAAEWNVTGNIYIVGGYAAISLKDDATYYIDGKELELSADYTDASHAYLGIKFELFK